MSEDTRVTAIDFGGRLSGRDFAGPGQWEVTFKVTWDGQEKPLFCTLRFGREKDGLPFIVR